MLVYVIHMGMIRVLKSSISTCERDTKQLSLFVFYHWVSYGVIEDILQITVHVIQMSVTQ